MKLNTVCQRDCPGRYPGCSAGCAKWQAEREEKLARYQERADNRLIEDMLADGARRRGIRRKTS